MVTVTSVSSSGSLDGGRFSIIYTSSLPHVPAGGLEQTGSCEDAATVLGGSERKTHVTQAS